MLLGLGRCGAVMGCGGGVGLPCGAELCGCDPCVSVSKGLVMESPRQVACPNG